MATGLDPCQPIELPGHPPTPTGCSQESVVLVTLPPGPYTAIVSGVGGGTGVGLVEVFEVFPDIRGTYTGTGTVFLNNCTDLTEPSITVTIPQQTGAEFRGTAVLTGPVGNLLFRQSLFFNSEANHGTIGADGSVNGSYTFVLELDSGFGFEEINSGPGGFSGSLSGNTLNVTFITNTTSGGVCIGIVLLTVTRVDFCTTNADCQSEQFCAKDVGDCQGTGICTAKAEVCPSVFVPACGCDGITYSNSCNAAAAGVSLLHEGMCTP